MRRQLSDENLEQALEILAVAINNAGSEMEMAFLSKSYFVLASQLSDIKLLEDAIEQANADP